MSSKNSQKNVSLLVQLRDFGLGPIIGVAVSMLTVPVTTRMLAPEEYGKSSLFTLFQSLFLVIGLLGIDQGYVRYYNNREIDRTKLFQNALFFPTLLSIALLAIVIIFFEPISTFLFGSLEIGLMVAFCFFIPMLLLNRFFLLQIRMDLRGKTYSFLNVFSQILNFGVLLVLLLFYQKSFRSIVYATIISGVVNTVVAFLFCNKGFVKQKFEYLPQLQKDLLKFSLPLVPAVLLSWLLNSFDKVGLRTWSDFNQLGLYSAAFKIVALLNMFQNVFSTAWIPVAYRWYEEKVPNKKFDDVSSLVLATMVTVFSLILVFRNVIMLFLGEDYRDTARIFVFLLFVPVMNTVSETTGLGINFSKKTIYNLYVFIIAVVLNLMGNFLLIPRYGAEGAAITTCISYIVYFWLKTFFSRKFWFKFRIGKYLFDIVLLLAFGINMILWQSKVIEMAIFFFVVVFNAFLITKIFKSRRTAVVYSD